MKYSAELSTQPGKGIVTIHVNSTLPVRAEEQLLQAALNYIQLGASDVLVEKQLDGVLTLTDLVIHDVDCNPRRFRAATSDAIRRLLEEP